MKIIVAGDFCPHHQSLELIEQGRHVEMFAEIQPIVKSADYSLVNFECPIKINPNAKPIAKCGPNLHCTTKAIDAIKYMGFKGVTLANNHVMDYGEAGLNDTLHALKLGGLDVMGVGDNLIDAAKVFYKTIMNEKVAIINCCEHEFSVATKCNSGANPLNPVQQYYQIEEARHKADYVIVIVHGGHEHFQLPSPRMKELYRFYIDCGADAVINHHQHCYSGYEIYKSKPIFYGLGNFFFDWNNRHNGIWTEGYVTEIILDKTISFNLIPYKQCASATKIELMLKQDADAFYENINRLSKIITDDKKLQETVDIWMSSNNYSYKSVTLPYSTRWLKAAAMRGWIPTKLTQNKILGLINYIQCEAHRDRYLAFLNNLIK